MRQALSRKVPTFPCQHCPCIHSLKYIKFMLQVLSRKVQALLSQHGTCIHKLEYMHVCTHKETNVTMHMRKAEWYISPFKIPRAYTGLKDIHATIHAQTMQHTRISPIHTYVKSPSTQGNFASVQRSKRQYHTCIHAFKCERALTHNILICLPLQNKIVSVSAHAHAHAYIGLSMYMHSNILTIKATDSMPQNCMKNDAFRQECYKSNMVFYEVLLHKVGRLESHVTH
jgi:hypothetical protein